MKKIFMGKLSIYFLKTNICAFLERAGKQEGKVIEEDEEKGMKEMLQMQENVQSYIINIIIIIPFWGFGNFNSQRNWVEKYLWKNFLAHERNHKDFKENVCIGAPL